LRTPQSLRLRLTAGVVAILALALAVCCTWMVHASGKVIEASTVSLTAEEESRLLDRIADQLKKMGSGKNDTALRYAFSVLSSQSESSSEYVLQLGEKELYNNSGISPQALLQAKGKPITWEFENYTYALWEHGGTSLCAVGRDYLYFEDVYTVSVVKDVTEQMDQVKRLRLFCILIGAAVTCTAGLFIAFFLAKTLGPLSVLQRSAKEIASGNYSQRIRVLREDEVGLVAENFNTMAEAVQSHIAEVEKTSQERNVLLHALAHEMRTPVTTISGYAYALTHMRMSEEQWAESLAFLESESRRLERLSTKLTELIMATDALISLNPIPSQALQAQVGAILAPVAEKQGIQLEIDLGRDVLLGDPDLLIMLLTNLYDNARKAGAKTVKIHLEGGCLSVKDDGCGISKELLDKIMQPFFQGDASRNQEGFGLGLSLCRRIAALHGSDLTVESEPGAGSTFTTLLQLHDDSKMDPRV